MIIPRAQRLKDIGEYYFSKKLEEIRQRNREGQKIINLGIGSPDLTPSKETINAAVTAMHVESNHGYSSYRSSPELRRALSQWYDKIYKVKLNPETEILPLLGSKEGIFYLSLSFCNAGETILIPNPGYPAYSSVAKLVGAEVQTYELTGDNEWFPDFRDLEKRDLSCVKMMWVNYPHMPTGKSPTIKLFKDLIAFGRRHNILICHDNPYSLVLNEEPPLSILSFDEEKEVCLEINSFSKAFNMAGWRVGMVAGSKEIIDTILQVKSNVDSGMFAPIQSGAIAALSNSTDWHSNRNNIYRERREIVFKIFDSLKFAYVKEQAGLFVWAQAPKEVDNVEEFLDELLNETQVFLTPGFIFGSQGLRYARSSLCVDIDILRQALARIERWQNKNRESKNGVK